MRGDGINNTTARVKSFDGIRVCAILLVMLFHIFATVGLPIFHVKSFTTLFFPFFFIGSGYFIGQILLFEYRSTNRIQILKFLARRALRTWPIYFIGLLIAVFLSPDLPEFGIFPYVFFFQNFLQVQMSKGFYIHSWTLAIEEQFYLIMPFLTYFFCRFNFYRNGIVLLFVLSIFCRWYFNISFSSDTNHSLLWSDGLLFGLYFAHPGSDKVIKFLTHWAVLIQILTISTVLILRYFMKELGYQYWTLTFLCTLFFIFSVFSGNSLLNRFFSLPIFQYLANRSYSYYVFHFIPILLFSNKPQFPLHVEFILILSVTFLIGEVSWRFIETPILKYRDGVFPKNS